MGYGCYHAQLRSDESRFVRPGDRPDSDVHHLLDLLRRDPDGTVQRDAGAGEESGEEVALVALDVGQETAGLDRAAATAGDDERKIRAGVFVAVLETGAPHHDAVVEQRAAAF